MGVLECGGMAINGFWDIFGMHQATWIFKRLEQAEVPDAVIGPCPDCGRKHIFDPLVQMMWEMGNVASAIVRARELTNEAREMFGDPTLMAWWWADQFDRRTIEMAQEALAKSDVDENVRKECEWKLEDALFYLVNAETVAQEVVAAL